MNLVNYLIEVNLGIILLYAGHQLLLANETDFKAQRAYLLTSIVISLVAPLFHLSGALITKEFKPTIVLPELIAGTAGTPAMQSWTAMDIAIATYSTGTMLLLIPFITQAVRLYRTFKTSPGHYENKYYVIESNSDSPTYSFFRMIVIGRYGDLTEQERKLIILHEQRHAQLLHSVDSLAITVATIALWFNPFVWLYRRSLIRVHEYEADQYVSQQCVPDDYRLLLAKTALAGNGLLLTHQFNQSFILKRINMINQLKKKISSTKVVAAMLLAISYIVMVACTDQAAQSAESAASAQLPPKVSERLAELRTWNPSGMYEAVQLGDGDLKDIQFDATQSVEFLSVSPENGNWVIVNRNRSSSDPLTLVDNSAAPVEGMQAFYEKLSQVLVYPVQARQMGIEGKVFIECTIQPEGRATDYKVLRGLGAGCDAAALSALTLVSDKWKPAIYEGKAVAQKMVFPVMFKLQ